MKRRTFFNVVAVALLLPAMAALSDQSKGNKNMVTMKTSLGELTIELYPNEAPETVRNFLEYVENGFFDGTIFHRVIPGFVVQGGGLTPDMQSRETRAPIINEADNGLKNLKGTLSMARTSNPNSATSQFFINLSDNAFLDFTAKTPQGWGYAVFGKVIAGMDVVDEMATVPTHNTAGHQDVPKEPVVIENAEIPTAE